MINKLDPRWHADAGDCFIATGTATLIAGLAAAGTAATSGLLNRSAASSAQQAQTAANNQQVELQREATRAQQEAADKALAFEKEQAAQAFAIAEANRRGNYDQANAESAYDADRWASRQGSISSIGERLGLPARAIPQRRQPAYVPLPGSLGAAGGAASSGIDPKLQSAISAYQAANPASKGIEGLTSALKSQGFNVGRFMYGSTPSNNELSIGGQKFKVGVDDGSGGLAGWYVPGTDDSAPGGGATAAPAAGYAPYVPGSLASIGPMTPAYVAPRVQLRA